MAARKSIEQLTFTPDDEPPRRTTAKKVVSAAEPQKSPRRAKETKPSTAKPSSAKTPALGTDPEAPSPLSDHRAPDTALVKARAPRAAGAKTLPAKDPESIMPEKSKPATARAEPMPEKRRSPAKRAKAEATPEPIQAAKPAARPAKSAGAPAPVRAGQPFRGYRVTREDGCEAEVRASVGCFYLFDAETVAFYCRDPEVARRVRRRWSDEVRVFSQGDDEATLLLPARLYPAVASLIGVDRRAA